MAEILISDLDDDVVKRLKKRAHRNGRSLEAEVKAILEEAVRVDMESARELADAVRAGLKGRTFGDSADLIREDRDR